MDAHRERIDSDWDPTELGSLFYGVLWEKSKLELRLIGSPDWARAATGVSCEGSVEASHAHGQLRLSQAIPVIFAISTCRPTTNTHIEIKLSYKTSS